MANSPSLKGLQALEVATRTGSFAAAARELSVSQAAVSQLVRALEDQIGRKLFHRVNRSIVPTEAGLEIFPRLSAAFEEIRGVSSHLSGAGPKARLVISVPPSVVTGWLTSRLSDFLSSSGPVDVSVRGEEDPVDFERDLIDIRWSYGPLNYRLHTTTEIVTDTVYPVCSPECLRIHGPFESPESLLTAPIIHTVWGLATATYPTWRSWFESVSVVPVTRFYSGTIAHSSVAALDLAINGLGVALCQGMFVKKPIEEGKLIRLFDASIVLSQPYCLTVPEPSASRVIVSEFRDWITSECRDSVSPQ